jgi:hypothetical protein
MNIKTNATLFMVALSAIFGAINPAEGSFIVKAGDFVRLYSTPGRVSNGGEFLYKRNNVNANWSSSSLDSARTFCCEMTEFMNFDTTYRVASVGRTTVATDKTLSVGVASLYRKWYDGMASNQNSIAISGATYIYNDNSQRGKDARALQIAIWWGMGFDTTSVLNAEAADIRAKANTWINYISDMNASAAPSSDLFGIRIMNLKTMSEGNAQDQLVAVPEPGSLCALLFFGGAATIFARRKRA